MTGLLFVLSSIVIVATFVGCAAWLGWALVHLFRSALPVVGFTSATVDDLPKLDVASEVIRLRAENERLTHRCEWLAKRTIAVELERDELRKAWKPRVVARG